MANLEFWSSLVSLPARPLNLLAVIVAAVMAAMMVLAYVLRHPLGTMIGQIPLGATIGRVTELTIGKWFSVKMTPSVSTVGQEAAAENPGNDQPENPWQEAHGTAPVSPKEQVHQQERTDETSRAASLPGPGRVHRRFDDDRTMSVSAMSPPRRSGDSTILLRADSDEAMFQVPTLPMGGLDKQIADVLALVRADLDKIIGPLVDAAIGK